MEAPDIEDTWLVKELKEAVHKLPHGEAAKLCQETPIASSELSNWIGGRRALPAYKCVFLLDWLIAKYHVTIERTF